MSEKSKKKPDAPKKKDGKKPVPFTFPILQGNDGSLDDEMQEIFDEDKVEHRHGRTEPERD